MSDSKGPRGTVPRPVRQERGIAPWSEGTRSWADRAPVAKVTGKVPAGPSRHSAITRSLSSYANYKNWADKVRTQWDPEQVKGEPKV